jgi:hypothetical protein
VAVIVDRTWPDYGRADITRDAYFARMTALEGLLIAKTGLEKEEVLKALNHPDPETKEKVAVWLRAELKKLIAGQKSGEHPVRRGKTISLPQIADAAFTMIECYAINDQLLALIQELLEVDRHRRALAANQEKFNQAASLEALIQLQGDKLGVRDIARRVTVSASTASQWKKSAEFQAKVLARKESWRRVLSEYLDAITGKYPEIADAHAFRLAFAVYSLNRLTGATESELKDDAISLAALVVFLRLNLAQSPISIKFLPARDYSRVTSNNVRRQKGHVIRQVNRVFGHRD